MTLYLSEKQMPIWQFSKKLSLEDNVIALLVKMAIYRHGKWERTSLELFTQYLVPLDLRAFQVAMAMLSETQRDEGETTLPSLGDILAAMEEAREVWPNFAQDSKTILTEPVYAEPEVRRLKA